MSSSHTESKLCLVVNDVDDYFKPFKHLGLKYTTDEKKLVANPESIGLVVFTGGEDVSPELYSHDKCPHTRSNHRRDMEEQAVFELARKHDIPMVGICRGAQFLCVMAGGELVQDVSGHANGGRHKLAYYDDDGNVVQSEGAVTSTHHQMQYPFNMKEDEYQIVAWTPQPLSRHYWYKGNHIPASNADGVLRVEPDVVYYPKIKALGIQYHPEWMQERSWGFKYSQYITNKFLGKHIKR